MQLEHRRSGLGVKRGDFADADAGALTDRGPLASRRPVYARLAFPRRLDQHLVRDAELLVQPPDHGDRQPRMRASTSAIRVRVPIIAYRSLRVRPCCSIRNLIASIGSGGFIGYWRSS